MEKQSKRRRRSGLDSARFAHYARSDAEQAVWEAFRFVYPRLLDETVRSCVYGYLDAAVAGGNVEHRWVQVGHVLSCLVEVEDLVCLIIEYVDFGAPSPDRIRGSLRLAGVFRFVFEPYTSTCYTLLKDRIDVFSLTGCSSLDAHWNERPATVSLSLPVASWQYHLEPCRYGIWLLCGCAGGRLSLYFFASRYYCGKQGPGHWKHFGTVKLNSAATYFSTCPDTPDARLLVVRTNDGHIRSFVDSPNSSSPEEFLIGCTSAGVCAGPHFLQLTQSLLRVLSPLDGTQRASWAFPCTSWSFHPCIVKMLFCPRTQLLFLRRQANEPLQIFWMDGTDSKPIFVSAFSFRRLLSREKRRRKQIRLAPNAFVIADPCRGSSDLTLHELD